MDLMNCPDCGNLFLKNPVRDVCDSCYKKEEAKYDEVYKFLRQRENRAATIERVAEATDTEEELLYKWVRKGRLHPAKFPNLGYPCDKCGKLINKGKICESCSTSLTQELDLHEREESRQEALRNAGVYHSQGRKQ